MEIAEEQVEVEFLGDEVASLRGIAQKKGKPSEEDKRDVRAYSDALKALKIKSARIKVAHNRNGELLEQIKIIDRITDLSFLFGCALMIFGFKAWYHKVQVHQDRILKKQAEGAV
jgi:hypothetical protein